MCKYAKACKRSAMLWKAFICFTPLLRCISQREQRPPGNVLSGRKSILSTSEVCVCVLVRMQSATSPMIQHVLPSRGVQSSSFFILCRRIINRGESPSEEKILHILPAGHMTSQCSGQEANKGPFCLQNEIGHDLSEKNKVGGHVQWLLASTYLKGNT